MAVVEADPPELSTMTVLQLKRELMDLNDSSFVFNDRDELECALKAARRVEASKKSAGFVAASAATASADAADADAADAASTATDAASTDASSATAAAAAYARRDTADSVASEASSAGGKGWFEGRGEEPAADRAASPTEAKVDDFIPPDLKSLGSDDDGTTSRGTSLAREEQPAPPAAPASPPPASSPAADIFEEEEKQEPTEVSRRLVEYFVMVSCVAVDDAALPSGRKGRKGSIVTPARPPDPARDKMNSRTRGRFDVRRVHLSNGGGDVGGEEEEEELDEVASTLLEPKITARYPPKDHADQPLNLRLPQFCHPEGTDFIHPTTEYKMPRVHHFVLTDSSGGKQYGTALTVFEEFKGKHSERGGSKKTYYAPRVLVLLSTWPYLTAFRTYLTQLYRLATTTDVMTAPIERYVLNICAEVPAPPPGAIEVQLNILGSNIRFWAPPANQPIPYVSLPFKVLFECLDIGNILFAWYTLACEQKVLLVSGQLSLLTVCSEILNSLLFPMKWSHLYIPVLPRSLSPMLDAPMPYLCGISRENFPYAVEDISDETVVVDLDRNVITLGPNTPDLPPLPHNRRKKLEATLKANAGEVFWEARNLTKADVLRVRASGDEGGLGTMLDQAGAVWEEKIRTRDSAFNLAHAPDSVSLQFDEDANVYLDEGSLPKQSRWDAVQEAFLRFYVSLLQDYRKFLPQGANMDERTSWRGKEGLSSLRFQTEEFIAAAPSEFAPFLEELVMTQQFDDFVTRKMHNAADAPDIKFFDQSIDAKRNRSKLKLKKKETPFLHSASAHRDLKRVQAVEPNTEGLPPREGGDGPYMYESWPLGFDEALFGAPRPIPNIISAEFDRRTALQAMLRSQHGVTHGSRGLGGRNRSPEVTAFILFFDTFTRVIGKEFWSVEQKRRASGSGSNSSGGPGLPTTSESGSIRSLATLDDDTEVARTIARAQIDLGYHTLSLMRLRKLRPEPIVYKLLIQACGRTKVTHRASALMDMLARDGLATNSEIYASLIAAFSNDESRAPSSLALYRMYGDDNASSRSLSTASTANQLESRANFSEHSASMNSATASVSSTGSGGGGVGSSARKGRTFLSGRFKMRSKKNPGTPKVLRKNSRTQMAALTPPVAKQIELGESLLESLYPGLDIDTENACPKCASILDEGDINAGWTPCASDEYETTCYSCGNEFVPKFSVSCRSPSFEGSQGKGTPLYCDLLSPWVLLHEIRSVIAATEGVESMIDENFRKGSDISATLWWNMIVTFRTYKLPFIFLLQGSFQNQLILPSPLLNETNHSDVSSQIIMGGRTWEH